MKDVFGGDRLRADAAFSKGDILRHRNELSEATRWFEGAIALDPQFGWALGHLAQALGALGRQDALRTWAGRWESAPTVATLHGLSVARGWLGDVRGAAEAAQRSVVLGAGVSAQEDLFQAKLFAGEYAAVEEGARVLAMTGSPVRRIGYYGLAAVEAYRATQASAVQIPYIGLALTLVAKLISGGSSASFGRI